MISFVLQMLSMYIVITYRAILRVFKRRWSRPVRRWRISEMFRIAAPKMECESVDHTWLSGGGNHRHVRETVQGGRRIHR